MNKSNYYAQGMRRIRLLLWAIYNCTPLNHDITEQVERAAAARCGMAWDEYLSFKTQYADLWQRAAIKRKQAKALGRFPPQPWQLRVYRKENASINAKQRKMRPRLLEWASEQIMRQRRYRQPWRRQRVLNRVMAKVMGN